MMGDKTEGRQELGHEGLIGCHSEDLVQDEGEPLENFKHEGDVFWIKF